MDRYYPDLDSLGTDFLLPVRVVLEQMLNDPLWLERGDCPYSDAVKDALAGYAALVKSARKEAVVAKPRLAVAGLDRWQAMSEEAAGLYDELLTFRDTTKITDAKEMLAYYRTASQLLDRLTNLGERAINLKQVSEFQDRVLRVFDAVLTPEQRTQAQRILEGDAG